MGKFIGVQSVRNRCPITAEMVSNYSGRDVKHSAVGVSNWNGISGKTVFPTDDSLFKMLYLVMIDITKKWTGRRKDWGEIHSQLEIYFDGRLK